MKSAQNLRRISEKGVQNLQVMLTEFSVSWRRLLTTLIMCIWDSACPVGF